MFSIRCFRIYLWLSIYITILMPRHNCWVGGHILIMMICLNVLIFWISHWGICVELFYKLCFLVKGLGHVYKWNSTEFLGVIKILVSYVIRFGFLFFKRIVISKCFKSFWLVFREIGIYSKTCDNFHVSTFGSGCDNYLVGDPFLGKIY